MEIIVDSRHRSANYGEAQVCPLCDSSEVHIEGVTVFPNDKDRSGQSLAINFYGDCGHRWSLEYIRYMGETLLNVIVRQP